jgi:type II secretion system protein G
MNVTKMKKQAGFTLMELIVVMAILGLLATVGLASFRSSQLKSRDAKRKSDLEQVQRALEMYHNDYGGYPQSNNSGQIMISSAPISWRGGEMKDSKTLYMKELPGDPSGSPQYCYQYVTDPSTGYQLYAKLENSQDAHCIGGIEEGCKTKRSCGGSDEYNYGAASSNLSP